MGPWKTYWEGDLVSIFKKYDQTQTMIERARVVSTICGTWLPNRSTCVEQFADNYNNRAHLPSDGLLNQLFNLDWSLQCPHYLWWCYWSQIFPTDTKKKQLGSSKYFTTTTLCWNWSVGAITSKMENSPIYSVTHLKVFTEFCLQLWCRSKRLHFVS